MKLHGPGFSSPKIYKTSFASEGCDDTNCFDPGTLKSHLKLKRWVFVFTVKSHHQGKDYSMSMISSFSCCSSRCGVPAGAGEILGGWWHGRKWRRRNWRGAKAFFSVHWFSYRIRGTGIFTFSFAIKNQPSVGRNTIFMDRLGYCYFWCVCVYQNMLEVYPPGTKQKPFPKHFWTWFSFSSGWIIC